MSLFDRHIMVDWSGGNDTGPTPRKDAIWVCEAGEEPRYFRNRNEVEAWLDAQIGSAVSNGERLAIGFDFAFGFPRGFAKALTGSGDPFAVWAWLADRIEDDPKGNNRFDVAGKINAMFPGVGPFWANGLPNRDIPHLPRKGLSRTENPFPEKRAVELQAKGSFAVWQLAGAGAVGSQVLMGLPVLQRLRRTHAPHVSVWPFEPLDTTVAFIEIWPSLVSDRIEGHTIKDAAQVRTLANIAADMDRAGTLAEALQHGDDAREEGWIFGVGCEALLTRTRPPKLSNDCFALPQGVTWTPVDDALAYLRNAVAAVTQTETVPTAEACGRVLSDDVIALRSNPPAANSAVDGYGFAFATIENRQVSLPLIEGRAAAGAQFEGKVPAGAAIRILTGALVPDGIDTVVLQEDCMVSGGRIAFENRVKQGANTRKAGEDVASGDPAFRAGHKLRPHDLALLTAIGHRDVPVRERLRVGVLSTGTELDDPSADAPPHITFDANRPMLLSLLRAWGHDAVDLGRIGDSRHTLRRTFDTAAQSCDAILTSGGASAGDEDHVSGLLEEAGSLNIWRIALKPGRPLALGLWEGVPVFGLPGNPVAAFTCALLFAYPTLSKMAGGGWQTPQTFNVPAAFTKTKKAGRREFLRARLNEKGHAEVFASEGSGRISGLSWARGFVELPDAAGEVQPGDPVRYIPFSSFGL